MDFDYFSSTFKSLPVPVLVCRNTPDCTVVFANTSARILLDPMYLDMQEAALHKLLRFEQPETLEVVRNMLDSLGFVKDYPARLITADQTAVGYLISANMAEVNGGDYLIFYLSEGGEKAYSAINSDSVMSRAFHAAYHHRDIDDAINAVLAIAGEAVDVSRCYIFELAGKDLMNNTYEWCTAGIEPEIQNLQNLRQEDLDLERFRNGGLYIVDDIKNLPEYDREMLGAQGIKSICIIPIFQSAGFLGYIGFDDCKNHRQWSSSEVQLLKNISNLVTSLITRRNAEERTARSLGVLQTILNNIKHVIYVNRPDSYEVVFINKTGADSIGATVEELIGQPCWKALQRQDGPCAFCPMPKMMDSHGNILREHYSWEFQNPINHRWYDLNDSIIPWMDGEPVHIETALDITEQKNHEEQLRYIASIDTMTGVYNREWGYKIMRDMMADAAVIPQPVSLVFIDLDGLKLTNDTYGHDAGDNMITGIVDAIRACIRKSDAICRWGGDEFLLLLRCDPKVAESIMKKIQARLEEINRSNENPYKLSFSYGIQDLTANLSDSIDTVVSKADLLMYEQKMAKREER